MSQVRSITKVIDESALKQIRGIGDHVFADVLTTYLQSLPVHLQNIDGAIDAGSADALEFSALAFGSSSLQFGALTVARFCTLLETTARTATKAELSAYRQALYAATLQLREALENRFGCYLSQSA